MKKKQRTLNDLQVGIICGIVMVITLSLLFFGFTRKYNNKVEYIAGEEISAQAISKAYGELITIHGFMSPYSPADGSFIYIMAKPYDVNMVEDSLSTNCVHVFPKEDSSIVFSGVPVTCKGYLNIVDDGTKDIFGVGYNWCLTQAEVIPYESDTLSAELYTYSSLVAQGIVDTFVTGAYAMVYDVNYKDYGYTEADLESYSTSNLAMAANMCGLREDDLSQEMLALLNNLGETLDTLNNLIVEEKYSELIKYQGKCDEILTAFSEWCEKCRIERV